MKWALIGIVGLALIGGAVYGVHRWTSAPEQIKEWMAEQDLKNFPTQARRELADMKKDLENRKSLRRDLSRDIVAREGREDWNEDTLKQEVNGLATLLWYNRMIERNENAIRDIVNQVREQRDELIAAGTIDADTGRIPADHKYSIRIPSGRVLSWTEADARTETDKLARQNADFVRRRDMQQRVIEKKKEYVAKLDSLVTSLSENIDRMELFIGEMEVELQLLEIEKDIHAINEAIHGKGDNKFGTAIARFREQQRNFLAEKELLEVEQPATTEGYFSEPDTTTTSGASASYWD